MLDANVVVGFLTAEQGSIYELQQRARDSAFQPVVSPYILGEVVDAWSEPYWRRRIAPADVPGPLLAIDEIFEVINVPSVVAGVAPHTGDDAVLAAALVGQVDALVTGDRQLLELRAYQGVRIVTARQFLELLDAT